MLWKRKSKCVLVQAAAVLCHRKITTKTELEDVDEKLDNGGRQI
jgi:hypothetical protein